jgi:glycogen debranching enzyme
MVSETVHILEGDTFVVSDRRGDIGGAPEDPHGLFYQDTRYLSEWRFTVGGESPRLLSTDDATYFSAQFFLVPPECNVYANADYSIIRRRSVGGGFHEDLRVLNHAGEPLELELHVAARADFADLFEVKDALVKKGRHYRAVEQGRLVLGYRRDNFVRETWVTASAPEAEFGEDGVGFRIRVEPHGEWRTCLDVITALHAFGTMPDVGEYHHCDAEPRPDVRATLEEWLAAAPRLSSDWRSLELTYERSLVDLAALRFYPPILPDLAVPAAGLPWFMTVFGRDSLIASYQALPFTPELAASTLRALAARQGTRVDDFRDEEPGRILHEARVGELTAFEERPHSPYYGTTDATPLFLILLDETERWTGDGALVRELEREGRAALAWIADYGDRDGDGYVEYERRNVETGLENQCWKDSHNSIVFDDGSPSALPRATCEIQGYVYDAKLRAARLARDFWSDPELADRLEAEARALKERFNDDFWIEDRGYFALALDGDKRRVDSLTSNIGHLLWSGIVADDKAGALVRHLMGDRLFSGWGVRTMAVGAGAYNPLGYHNGTVWPHDNSLIAHGLARYGYRDEAARIVSAMLEAAEFFGHRLPEAFAGYARSDTRFPVEYPTACSPQAWASGAPLLFVRTLLGLEPHPTELRTHPHLPAGVTRLELEPGRRRVASRAPKRAAFAGPGRLVSQRAIAPSATLPPGVPRAAELFDRFEEFIDPAKTRREHATYRFEIVGVGTWTVAIDDGRVSVAAVDGEAACSFRMNEETFVRVFDRRQHPFTAILAGTITVEGNRAMGAKLAKFRR